MLEGQWPIQLLLLPDCFRKQHVHCNLVLQGVGDGNICFGAPMAKCTSCCCQVASGGNFHTAILRCRGFEMATDVLERQWPIRVGILLLPAATLQRPPPSERAALQWDQLSGGEKLTVGFNMLEDAFGASEGLQFVMRAAEQAVPAAVGLCAPLLVLCLVMHGLTACHTLLPSQICTAEPLERHFHAGCKGWDKRNCRASQTGNSSCIDEAIRHGSLPSLVQDNCWTS